MRIVVDSNRVIAALVKNGTTRNLLLNKKFEFVAPSYIFSEINKYKNYIIDKTRVSGEEFNLLLSILFEDIRIIPELEYNGFLKNLKIKIQKISLIWLLQILLRLKEFGHMILILNNKVK